MASVPEPQSVPLIERHPPERRQRRKDFVVLYSCCCCCCCCLHTVGGLIGAATGGNFRTGIDEDDGPWVTKPLPSTQYLYWTSLGIVFVLVILGYILGMMPSHQYYPGHATVFAGIAFVLAGPLFSLGASLVMALRIGLTEDLRKEKGYWRSLGRITGFSVLGAVIGFAVMAIPFFLMVR